MLKIFLTILLVSVSCIENKTINSEDHLNAIKQVLQNDRGLGETCVEDIQKLLGENIKIHEGNFFTLLA